jgi:hypothetical protein
VEEHPDDLTNPDIFGLVNAEHVQKAQEANSDPGVDQTVLGLLRHLDRRIADQISHHHHQQRREQNKATYVNRRMRQFKPGPWKVVLKIRHVLQQAVVPKIVTKEHRVVGVLVAEVATFRRPSPVSVVQVGVPPYRHGQGVFRSVQVRSFQQNENGIGQICHGYVNCNNSI